MSEITITIDNQEIKTKEGEYILNAARANGIFIPAICYLTRCSPTLACRLCLVEADGKQVYACNAKSKEGMQVTTSTQNIESEKRSIMEVYNVNHPLQCGVCDQSGECELQNYTLEVEVDSQNYAVPDVERKVLDWGHIHYDPALCIVCERCSTVCKDMIGDNSLKTVPRGSEGFNTDYKESMPKDAYAMWNKLNKSIIGLTSGEQMLDCTACGECSAVCPVGALTSTDFMYKTNAWEQKQIPATCSHCSAGCQIQYDVKHTDIENSDDKIYGVKNEWNYVSLCGAGRYGYDFENAGVSKDESAFNSAIEAFKKADTIKFNSIITNEEALILQRLKKKFGYKLINEEARSYGNFLNEYKKISGTSLYSGDLNTIRDSNFVVSVGTIIKSDNPNARFAFNNSMTMNKGAGLYFHPVADPVVSAMSKNMKAITHAPLQEEVVLYLILDLFANKEELPKEIVDYLATFHSTKTITVSETIKEQVIEMVVDAESGEEKEVKKMVPKKVSKEVEVDDNRLVEILKIDAFDEFMEKQLKKKDTFSLIVGEDFYTHPNSRNLARLVALIEKYSDFSVTIIPPRSNSLGVSLICDLDSEAGAYAVGYNEVADFTLCALGEGDLDMPAFNQQEGTLTSINKRVNPTNAALSYGGYTLNDLASALGVESDLTIDYTSQLPTAGGFKSTAFDDLSDHFTNAGEEVRGYALNVKKNKTSNESVEPFNEDEALAGELIYYANPVKNFSKFSQKAHQLNAKGGVFVSVARLESLGLKEGDRVTVETSTSKLTTSLYVDNQIDGDIAYLPNFDTKLNSEVLFNGYRFNNALIAKVI
ncbi:MAG: NADH-quinone oxidoreductase subunit G [Helicobacteraceae bacterium]|nr:NADH-quinone oxidoreductase subunit G [Helicobacteraceae bacterium]